MYALCIFKLYAACVKKLEVNKSDFCVKIEIL